MDQSCHITWVKPSRQSVFGYAGAFALFFLLMAAPRPEGLDPPAMRTLAVVAWAVVVWVTEAVPVGITGLIIPMLLFTTGALPRMDDAFAGFTAPTTYLCLGAFIFAALMRLCGLDKRIAVTILHVFKVKQAGELIRGMFVTNFVLALLIPATAARGATLLPIIKGLLEMFGDTPEERRAKSAVVIQSMVYATMICGVVIMTAHMPNIIMINLFEKKTGYSIGYLEWFWLHIPMLLLWGLIYYWTRRYFGIKGARIEGGRERIAAIRQDMGPVSKVEWLLLAMFALTAAAWVVSKPAFGLDAGMMTIAVLCVFFVPGLMPWKWAMIQKNTAWGTFLFLAGAMSLSVAMSKTGLAKYLAGLAQPLAMGQHWSVTLLIMMLTTHVIRIGMLSNVAAIAFLAPVMIDLAGIYGLNPIPFTLLVCDVDTFAFIIPTQVTVGVLAYSTGAFTMKDYALAGLGTMAISMVFDIAVMAPWYALNGYPLTP